MGDRVPLNTRVDEDVVENFEAFVIDAHGKKRGVMGREVENALREYMDRDRYARVEEKVDEVLARLPDGPGGHTHTRVSPSQQASESVQKARAIADRVYSNHAPIVKDADLERAIEDIAGGHPDTLSKYKGLLRKRGLLWEHPDENSPVWTTERKRWVGWAESYVDGVPSADLSGLLEPYDMSIEEYDDLAEEVAEA